MQNYRAGNKAYDNKGNIRQHIHTVGTSDMIEITPDDKRNEMEHHHPYPKGKKYKGSSSGGGKPKLFTSVGRYRRTISHKPSPLKGAKRNNFGQWEMWDGKNWCELRVNSNYRPYSRKAKSLGDYYRN